MSSTVSILDYDKFGSLGLAWLIRYLVDMLYGTVVFVLWPFSVDANSPSSDILLLGVNELNFFIFLLFGLPLPVGGLVSVSLSVSFCIYVGLSKFFVQVPTAVD